MEVSKGDGCGLNMNFVNWVNKIIKHNRDNEGDFGIRVLLHIPAGLVMSIPIFGWGFQYLFKFFEENEDLHTQDEAWKDTFGAMVGYVIGTGIIILILLLLFLN